MMADTKPEIVFHLAALSGDSREPRLPGGLLLPEPIDEHMVAHEAHRAGVRKFVTLIGGCSYPAQADNPIREEELWNGYPQLESAPTRWPSA